MKDLGTKVDNSTGPQSLYTADEFNDFHGDVQTAVTESGQTLSPTLGGDDRQLIKAISGGSRVSRTTGQTAEIGECVIPDNSAGAVTINLPTTGLYTGAVVLFEQVFDQPWSGNSLTVGRNGNTIGGLAEDMTVTTDHLRFGVRWDGSTWVPFKQEVIGATA